MICVVSLLVFSILGIVSARHRQLAKESLDCLTSTIKREPCDTGLDDRLQASIVGRVLSISPRLAKILNNHFRLFSWLVLILFVVSAFLTGQGLYNWAAYGNCEGEEATGSCTFNQITNLSVETNDPVANESMPEHNKTEVPP